MLRRFFLFSLFLAVIIVVFSAAGVATAWAVTTLNLAVSEVDSSAAIIVVETDVSSNVSIDYGLSPGSYTATANSLSKSRHEVALTSLPASGTVYYRVTIVNSANTADSVTLPEHSFHTARAAGASFSFGVAGDNRPGPGLPQPAVWHTITGQMAGENLDLALHVGDMIYGSGTDTLAQNIAKYDDYFSVTMQLTAAAPWYTAVGNHEWISAANNRAGYEQEFTLPRNNGANAGTDGEEYYSFDSGDTHFVVLCTELPGQEGLVTGTQEQWLAQDLAQSTKAWKVVALHRPFYGASGMHPTDPWYDTSNTAGQENRAEIEALFQQNGVDVVFSGHDHYYMHHVDSGIQYIITGGGGAPLYNLPAFQSGDIFGDKSYEHVKVDETPATLRISEIESTGTVAESFTLGAPVLNLAQIRSYWASYANYLARDLSVDYSIANSGGDAANLRFSYLAATNGVTTMTSTPAPVGNVASGGAAQATVDYLVPQGINYFRSLNYIACEDLAGQTHDYPGPAPVF